MDVNLFPNVLPQPYPCEGGFPSGVRFPEYVGMGFEVLQSTEEFLVSGHAVEVRVFRVLVQLAQLSHE
ncbi:hypothetical protein [Streptomyces mirabilis]|uniref:hypothetical protein n=1 Tax=Streptomyces mirabilis TaxID=68239 RepID=UPI0033C52FB9